MGEKILIIVLGVLLTSSLTGCGDSQNKIQPQYVGTAQSSLTRPFSDMAYGFTKMEKYVDRGDYSSAKTISRNLYDELHDTILPPLEAKKGKQFADKIDKNYDQLEAAVDNKNKAEIKKLIRVNKENLKTIAPILGVTLISF